MFQRLKIRPKKLGKMLLIGKTISSSLVLDPLVTSQVKREAEVGRESEFFEATADRACVDFSPRRRV